MIYRSGGVASASYASHQVVGVIAAFLFEQLFAYFFADDRLQPGNHVGVGMWSYGRAYDIIGVGRVATPVAYRFIGCVFQCHVTRCYGLYFRSQHFHFFNVNVLSFHIGFSHVYDTFHIHKGTYRRCGDAMLPGTGFGDNPGFSHAAGQQYLAYRVVYFMCAGVVQVFTFQIDFTTVLFRQSVGSIERRGPSYVITKQFVILAFERFAFYDFEIALLQFFYATV